MYRNLQRHRAVIPATARLLFCYATFEISRTYTTLEVHFCK